MKKALRFLMLFAIGLFLALSVTSCGDDDDDDTNSSNPSNNVQQGGTNPDDNGTNSEPAKNFTVTFNTDGGSEVVAQKVDDGKTATKPEDPTKEGFNFEGWFNGGTLYDFATTVTSDLTLTAKWNIKTLTVTFNTDGGSEVVAQKVDDGKTATKPEDPTKEGFDLEGWFNGESLYDFSAAVTSDLTLTAKWNIKTFTVTFNTDGGSEVGSQVVEYGKSVTAPEKPSKDGFFFMGWYVGENLYDFSLPVSNDLTITALWGKKTEYDVDLGLPSGTLWATCNVGAQNPWDYGDYFTWGETTTKDVYDWDTYTYNDEPSVLDASHDAATVNMGSNWRMPTIPEIRELLDNCDWKWTSDYNGTGVAGCIVKSRSNSNSLFLPASGWRDFYELERVGKFGYYWSSSVDDASYAWGLDFGSDFADTYRYFDRNHGFSVRAVRCK